MTKRADLGRAEARRIALAAQGFCDRHHAVPSMRTLDRVLRRTGVLQVDSVNVTQRAHLMPVYSRCGPYDTDLLRRAAERRPRRLVEYWAHVQALMPVELWPVMAHRMEYYRAVGHKWADGRPARALEEALLARIAERGASTSRELDVAENRIRNDWGWNWSDTRRALDHLYMSGWLAVAGRNRAFEIRYDLPERVIPADVLRRPALAAEDAARELIRRAAASYGVATERALRDYYRMPPRPARQALAELVESGDLSPVRVEGWSAPTYLHREARLPRTVAARTLLSPFDPVVWERDRTEQLFGFRYRLEIYVPAPQRIHGYYVLPFLLGDRLVARVDLEADRPGATLQVRGAYAEPDAPPATATELAAELQRYAAWSGLERVNVTARGDLAGALTRALGSSSAG